MQKRNNVNKQSFTENKSGFVRNKYGNQSIKYCWFLNTDITRIILVK